MLRTKLRSVSGKYARVLRKSLKAAIEVVVERLENRWLMAAIQAFDSVSHTVTLTGDNTSEVIILSHVQFTPDLKFTVNGTALPQFNGDVYTNVVVNANGGDDFIDLSSVAPYTTITGGMGNDTVLGSMWNDSIDGGAGNDDLRAGANFGGSNTLIGGDGDDLLFGTDFPET